MQYEKIDSQTYIRIEETGERNTVTYANLIGTIELLEQQLAFYNSEKQAVESLGVDVIEEVVEQIVEEPIEQVM